MTVDRETIVSALEVAGLDEGALYDDYSGRGMYGATCIGIVCSTGDALLFAAAIGSFADDWVWIADARSDSMGRSTIWYWPGVTLATEEVAT